ncbi:hypothetical protein FVE85_7975 [Porphyridium purpureum]|uniref:Uncharacterized protein n=1 Tax=Porphyridium purpureum TaxID=35688 RepID=A0A5J4YMJ6_PORPP|nr:hypothetical protein FVE85_7975 [Porphyridium purpureum]|eukprot:POR8431..scf295_9
MASGEGGVLRGADTHAGASLHGRLRGEADSRVMTEPPGTAMSQPRVAFAAQAVRAAAAAASGQHAALPLGPVSAKSCAAPAAQVVPPARRCPEAAEPGRHHAAVHGPEPTTRSSGTGHGASGRRGKPSRGRGSRGTSAARQTACGAGRANFGGTKGRASAEAGVGGIRRRVVEQTTGAA